MQPDLAALVGSRICHDLISPIGAISNGVELLSLTDGDTSNEMQLISDSVASANARIRFFRIAFGAGSADQMVSRSEILSILRASALGGRFTYFWQLEDDMSRSDLRLIFLLFQCFETAMPLGGEITVSAEAGAIKLAATGRRVVCDAALWNIIYTPPTTAHTVSAAQVHFALVSSASDEAGRSIDHQITDQEIVVTL